MVDDRTYGKMIHEKLLNGSLNKKFKEWVDIYNENGKKTRINCANFSEYENMKYSDLFDMDNYEVIAKASSGLTSDKVKAIKQNYEFFCEKWPDFVRGTHPDERYKLREEDVDPELRSLIKDESEMLS